MAARTGTVISGGFPGLVAQEVNPNPKCKGCLHFDGQGGRIGICTIGLRPWLCGDGDAADIGYAPIARGAGTYLHGMVNHGVQAHEVADQNVSSLYGAGSTRPVQFQQVCLGEEHIHFVKSFIAQYTAMQKSECRLCKSTGTTNGSSHNNIGPQVCTCEPIAARTVAKALMPRLSNRERSVVDLEDATAFIYDAAKAGFKASAMEKGTFYQQHGKYEVHPAGGGRHHVDFHPRGGGAVHRVGTFDSPKQARREAEKHHYRFASGTGADNAAPDHVGGEKLTLPGHRIRVDTRANTFPVAHKKSEDSGDIDKGLSWKILRTGQPRAEASHGTYRIQSSGDEHIASYRPNGQDFRTIGRGSHKEAKQAVAAHHAEFAAFEGGTRSRKLRRSEDVEDDIEKSLSWKPASRGGQTFMAQQHLGSYHVGPSGPHADGFSAHYLPKWGEAQHLGEHSSKKKAQAAAEKHFMSKAFDDDEEIEKGRRKTVATAPETPQTEKPYKTKFQRPNDSAKPESTKPSGFNIDTSKLRASGEAGAKKLMANDVSRTAFAAGVGQAADDSRTKRDSFGPTRTTAAPSVNRPGQNRQEMGGDGPAKPAAQVASKPAAPKHIEMPDDYVPSKDGAAANQPKQAAPSQPKPDTRMPQNPYADSSSSKHRAVPQSKPAASPSVPSMSTLPKKEERTTGRVSYKSVDETADAITKALDEIEKSKKSSKTSTEVRSPTSTKTRTATEVRSPTSTSTDAYTQGNVTVTGGAGSGDTHVHLHGHQAKQPQRADKEAHVERSRGAAKRPEKMMHETGKATAKSDDGGAARLIKAVEEIDKGLFGGSKPPNGWSGSMKQGRHTQSIRTHGTYAIHHNPGGFIAKYHPNVGGSTTNGGSNIGEVFKTHKAAVDAVNAHQERRETGK